MRLAAHIFAFVVVTMSLATPCFADLVAHLQKGDVAVQTSICDGASEQCGGDPVQAVITRAGDVEHQAVLPEFDDTPFLQLADNRPDFDRYATSGVTSKSGRCSVGVDLYYLCRQLN